MRPPPGLTALAGHGPGWASWLDRLPRLTADLIEEWELRPDGEPTHGETALVVPVRTTADRPAVLKVVGPHPAAEHEHLALKRWAGTGAVELLRADPGRSALLLERLQARDLTGEWDLAACEVVAGLYADLHVPALPQLRTLSSYAAGWSAELATLPVGSPVPHRMVQQAVALARDLAADPATDGTLVHGDLHYGSVLAAERAPWLAVAPRPVSGDPHYEPAPMLWHRWEETAGRVRDCVRGRFLTLVDGAGLDEDRARAWVVLRMVLLARGAVQEAERAGRPLDAGERDRITRCVAVVKAVGE